MKSFSQYLKVKMQDPEYKKHYDALEPEFAKTMPTPTNNQPPELKPAPPPSEPKIFNLVPRQMFFIAIAVVATALVAGGGVWWWMNGKIESERARLEQQIEELTRIAESSDTLNQQQEDTIPYQEDTIPYIVEGVFNGGNGTIEVAPGMAIVSPVLSHDARRVVYGEITKEIPPENRWNYDYAIRVKNFEDGKVTTLYTNKEKTSRIQEFMSDFFTAEVQAGGCPIEWFPWKWTKNDEKILLEWDVPGYGCGSGGAPDDKYAVIDDVGGSPIESIAREDAMFFDEYRFVVTTDESDVSPLFCGPGAPNNGKILLRDIEKGTQKVLFEENNTEYSLVGLDEQSHILTFKSVTNKEDKTGCSELGEDWKSREAEIVIE